MRLLLAGDDDEGRRRYNRVVRWLRRLDSRVVDALLGTLTAAVEVAGAWAASRTAGEPSLTALGVALLVVRSGALAFHRRHPYAVGAVVGAATGAYGLAELPDPVLPLAPLIALLAVILAAPRRVAVGITALVVVVALAFTVAAGDSDASDYYLAVLGPALALAVGEMERNRRAHEAEAAARAADEERVHIARELHDVVAHHVSMMVVQAEAGASVVPAGDTRARAAFDGIATTGRAAMTELRRLLAAWRTGGPSAELTEPQPGLERLDALVSRVRDAGVQVDVAIEGARRALPPGVDLSAYRIVQEALTNVMKHTHGARAWLVVRYGTNGLEIAVRDNGTGHGAGNGDAGHGLTGIRERVALFGGDVTAGPAPGGGFEVVARLPLDS